MTKVMHIAALFGWICFAMFSTRAIARDNFALAIRNQSTSTRLLLVAVEYPDHSQRVIATSGQALLGALAKERGFEKWPNRDEVARTAALVGRDRPFRFTKPDALKTLEAPDTPELLAEVRKKLGTLTAGELRERLRKPDGFKGVYPADPEQRSRYQLAVAQVLLEKNIPVQINCLDSSLGLAQ